MTEPRRHHYVPQFHLRRFASAARSGRFWRYDKHLDSVAEAGISRSAFATDYYTLPVDDGSRDTGIEAWLGNIESRAAPALSRLLALPAGAHLIGDDDRVAITLYLAVLHTRGPAARLPSEALADFLAKSSPRDKRGCRN